MAKRYQAKLEFVRLPLRTPGSSLSEGLRLSVRLALDPRRNLFVAAPGCHEVARV